MLADGVDQLSPEESEALALVLQSRNKIFNKKRKPKGKARGKGKRPAGAPGRGPTRRPPPPPTRSTSTAGSSGGSYDDRQRQQRKQHIADLKKKTQCLDCHEFGHWQGDDVCPNYRSRLVARQMKVWPGLVRGIRGARMAPLLAGRGVAPVHA